VKTPAKAALISVVVVIALAIAALVIVIVNRPTEPDASEIDGALPGARIGSHVLDEAGQDAPTLVEFLDFECEVCGAFHPVIEQLREEYDGEINYVVRYFPLPGHFNSMNAALAAEAAAEQGQFEAMYNRLFETQAQWGEQQISHADLFRGLAEEIGLDMEAYDASIADPGTRERVEEDFDDGQYLGVSGTPTFLLDGEPLELTQLADLTDALDEAVGR
jgi:protein-disulfide isomerase